METFEPFVSLGLALFVGLLVGLEREQSRPPDEPFLGGSRTYPMVALLGAVATMLSARFGYWLLGAAGAGVFALTLASYVQSIFGGRDHGVTSETALLLTFLLGALSMTELIQPLSRKIFVVSALSVTITLLLSVKPKLHAFIQRASQEDVLATLKFLIVAVVVLPLLPNEPFGPWKVLNPFNIGLLVVFIAGLSFVGYVAVRVLGPHRGLAFTGALGGLVSSTATTLALSSRAKEQPSLSNTCLLGVLLATTLMFVRVAVEVAVVHPGLLGRMLIPLGAMAGASLVLSVRAYLQVRRSHGGPAELQLSNPFELSTALKFALLFSAVLLGARAASEYLGTRGIYLAGLLAGTTDVDAITLSMANLAKSGEVEAASAVTTIFLGVASNTVVKAAMATVVGGWAVFGKRVAWSYGIVILAGAVSLLALWMV